MTDAQDNYYKMFQKGRYVGLYTANKKLYELMLLAISEKSKCLVVNFDTKPNDVIMYSRIFKLVGITFKTTVESIIGPIINVQYCAKINTLKFISNLIKFDNVSSIDIINTVNKRRQLENTNKHRKEMARIKASGNIHLSFPGSIGKIPIVK